MRHTEMIFSMVEMYETFSMEIQLIYLNIHLESRTLYGEALVRDRSVTKISKSYINPFLK
jgi:hypothetical protein|tara:strand:- start:738 stop:917 length:180 start_codon:yes stop_codon:yes gene_type:complete